MCCRVWRMKQRVVLSRRNCTRRTSVSARYRNVWSLTNVYRGSFSWVETTALKATSMFTTVNSRCACWECFLKTWKSRGIPKLSGKHWGELEKTRITRSCVWCVAVCNAINSCWQSFLTYLKRNGTTLSETAITFCFECSRMLICNMICRSLKVLDFFPDFQGLESPWKETVSLTVVESRQKSPLKCLDLVFSTIIFL